jgi:zinc protease
MHPTVFRSSGGSPPLAQGLVLVSLLLAIGACLITPGRAGTLKKEQIREFVYPSGLRLVVKEARAAELAAIQVWVQAGGLVETSETFGISHVIEHLVFKGTETGGPGSLDDEVEGVGGLLEATTEKDWIRFACTVGAPYAERVLKAIGEALRNPRLQAEDLEAERPVLLEEIDRRDGDPLSLITAMLYEQAYREHPYARDVRGSRRGVGLLEVEEVRRFYHRHFHPARMTVVVVGDVDAVAVSEWVKVAFAAPAHMGEPAEPVLPEPVQPCARADRRVLPTRLALAYVGLAFPAPGIADAADVHAMDVLLTLLEHRGSGRLPNAVRNRGRVLATYETRRHPGLFSVIVVGPPGEIGAMEQLVLKEIDLVRRQPVAPQELAYARELLRGSFALDNETFAGQATSLGYYAAIDRWQFAAEYADRVAQVTPAQVLAVAQKYLTPEQSVAVVLQPRTQESSARP